MSDQCPEAGRLMEIYTAALRGYEAAFGAVPTSRSHPEFERLNEARKKALDRMFEAREAHLNHLAEHRCGRPFG
jgi:hypothetical protein